MKRRLPVAVMATVTGLIVGTIALATSLGTRSQAQSSVTFEPTPLVTLPTALPTPTLGAAPQADAQLASLPLFSSDFADAQSLAAFEFVDLDFVLEGSRGRWSWRDNALYQDATEGAGNPSTHEIAAYVRDLQVGDGTISLSFYDRSNGVVGLIARRNGDTYYRYRIIANRYPARPKQVIEKVQDGVVTRLTEIAEPGFDNYAWHTLSMSVKGNDIVVKLDDTVVAEAYDPTPLPAGQVGVYSRAIGGLLVDNLVVSAAQ